MVDGLLRRELGERLRRQLAHLAALPEDRDPVAEAHRLVQLVGDEEDRDSGVPQPADDPAEVLHALRREHRGRLVEDQHALAPPERLDDLDELLLAEGERAERRVLRQRDAEQAGDLAQPRACRGAVHGCAPGGPQHQVLQHRERRHQGRVLVDGADAEIERGARARDPGLVPAYLDGAGIGALHAREDGDQRRLAGAVLAQQRVDLRRVDGERDRVVGDDSGETLGDVPQNDDRRGRTRGTFRGTGGHGQPACSPSCTAALGRPPGKGQVRPTCESSPPGAACGLFVRYSAASTDDIRARTSVASQIAGTSISPAMIWARTSISPAHISSEMCAVRSSCTESSASWMA